MANIGARKKAKQQQTLSFGNYAQQMESVQGYGAIRPPAKVSNSRSSKKRPDKHYIHVCCLKDSMAVGMQ